MEYSICFGASSICSLSLKQKEFEFGSLFGINIPLAKEPAWAYTNYKIDQWKDEI